MDVIIMIYQAVYHRGERVLEESRERECEVVFLRAGTKDTPHQTVCKLHHVEAGVPGALMSEDELTRMLVGRVQKITETICETTYQDGVVKPRGRNARSTLLMMSRGLMQPHRRDYLC